MPTFHVTAPTGEEYEVDAPEGSSEQDAINYVRKNQSSMASLKPQKNSFIDDVKSAYNDRVARGVVSKTAYDAGDQTGAETAFQFLGNSAGLANDVIGSGISHVTPDFIKKGLGAVVTAAGNLPTFNGSTLAKTLPGETAYLEERFPRASRNIGAAANIGSLAAPFVPIKGANAITSTVDTAKAAGQWVKTNKFIQSYLKNGKAGKPLSQIANPNNLQNISVKKVLDRLKADYPDPVEYQRILNKFIYGNKPVIEIGGNRTVNLAKGSAQYPSGEAISKDWLGKKIEETPDRIKSSLSKNVSQKSDYYATLDDIYEQGRGEASPLYSEAYRANPSVSSKEIDQILATPAGKRALSDARVIMQNDRSLMGLPNKELGDLSRELQKMGMMSETQGGVASGLNLRSLDYVKRALDDQIEAAQRAGQSSNARSIIGLKKSLVDNMDSIDRTGMYKKARQVSGDYLSNAKALEAGKDFYKLDAQTIQRQMSGMGASEQNAFRVGVVKRIRDDIDNAIDGVNLAPGVNLVTKIIGKKSQRDRLLQILGQKKYSELEADLLAEDKIYRIRNEVLSGSHTASKQIAASEFKSELGETAEDIIKNGWFSVAAGKTMRFIHKKFDGLDDKTAGEVAKILYETDPKEKLKIINRINSIERKKVLSSYFSIDKSLKKAKKLAPIGVVGAAPTLQEFYNQK